MRRTHARPHRRRAAATVVALAGIAAFAGVAASAGDEPVAPIVVDSWGTTWDPTSGELWLMAGAEDGERTGAMVIELADASCERALRSFVARTSSDLGGAAGHAISAGLVENGATYGVRARALWTGSLELTPWSDCAPLTIRESIRPLPAADEDFGAAPSLRPTLRALVPDDAPAGSRLAFAITDAATGALVASGQGTTAAPGAPSTFTPPEPLDEGREYTWTAGLPGSGYETSLSETFWAIRSPLSGRYVPRVTIAPVLDA